jgi:predicted nicotinamide N-methyase
MNPIKTTTTTTTASTAAATAAPGTRPLRARFVSLDDTPSPPEGVIVYEALDPGRAVDEAIASGAPAPYGAVLWDSAVELARRLHRADLVGRRVLELGCGCGLVGVVCARRGARVLCTDVDPHTLVAVERAAADSGVVVATALFDMCGAEPLPAVHDDGDADGDGGAATDVILADVLYEPRLAAAAARRALEALAQGARVFVGDPERAGRDTFIRLVKDAGVDVAFDGMVCVLVPAGSSSSERAPWR